MELPTYFCQVNVCMTIKQKKIAKCWILKQMKLNRTGKQTIMYYMYLKENCTYVLLIFLKISVSRLKIYQGKEVTS